MPLEEQSQTRRRRSLAEETTGVSSPAMEREEGSISPFADRYPKEFLMVYLEKGSIWLVIKGESGRFQLLEQLLDSGFSMDSALV